jgi:hypothetical protein
MMRMVRAASTLLLVQLALGDGVIPRWPEGSASKQAVEGQEPSAHWAVQGDGVMGVFGAAGEESARGKCTSTLLLIPLDGSQHPSRNATRRLINLSIGCPHLVDNYGS